MSKNLLVTRRINTALEKKNFSFYKLAKMIDYPDSGLCSMIQGRQSFSEKVIEKILPILELSREEFESWILADKYSKEVLNFAIQVKKSFPYKRKSIVTYKIDEILQQKGISRTALSKLIEYNQSGLNRMITGKINISKPVMKKLSHTLEISQDELLSWVLADKYSLEILELAYSQDKT